MKTANVAIIQTSDQGNVKANVEQAAHRIEQAAAAGARLVLPPELFEGPYFCKSQSIECFALAHPVAGHPTLRRMQALAKRLGIVLPISFFEREGPHYYNSLAVFDTTGELLGVYRKSHIPDGPGYQEKYYFRPGDTGLKVWSTQIGRVGTAICWDQWFPEVARELVLKGAELLVYPTAIGSEPENPDLDTRDLWQRAMVGHAVCNVVPILAANRTGDEQGQRFYGSSFICDHFGEKIKELSRDEEGIAMATLALESAHSERAAFGFFRDRRPDLYVESARTVKIVSTSL